MASFVTVVLIAATVTSSWFAYTARRDEHLLQNTLERLQEEILDQMLALALAGDVAATDEAAIRARQANADPNLINVFRALAHVYSGDLEKARTLLDQTRSKTPDNYGVMAASWWAYAYSGRDQESHDLWQDIIALEATGRIPGDDYEHLLLVSSKIFASSRPEDLIEDVNAIIERHKRWGIAYTVRSDLKRLLAWQTRDMRHFDDAIADAASAERYHPDNPFVLSSAMLTYTAAIEAAKHTGELAPGELDKLFEQAGAVASKLDRWKGFLLARGMRLSYYRLTNQTEAYESEYEELLEAGFGGDQKIAADLLSKGRISDLRSALLRMPRSCAIENAIAIQTAIDDDVPNALSMLDKMWDKYTNFNHRWLMLDVALICRRADLAQELAQRSLLNVPDGDAPVQPRSALLMTRYYAGEFVDDDAFLDANGYGMLQRSVGHYAVGMRKLAEARTPLEVKKAKEHLQVAADCPMPGWWHVVFAKAYLQLIEDERLPIRPRPGSEDH